MTGKERRQQLLDVGRHLFAERGLDGTSIEEIAAQAGVSKPVVYEHFGSKEGLYAVVVDREMDRFLTMADRLLEGEDTRAKFEAAAIGAASLHRREHRRVPDPGPRLPAGRIGHRQLRQPDREIAGQVEYTLRDALAARGYDPKHAPMYAQMLVGMVTFTGQWWLDARKPKLEEVAAHLVNLAWNGLHELEVKPRISAQVAKSQRARATTNTRRNASTVP